MPFFNEICHMCVNYTPPTRAEISALISADMSDPGQWPDDTWQDYAAPIIRSGPSAQADAELLVATYGMIPKRFLPSGRKHITTMNARAETIAQKPAYAKAWRQGQTCLVPMRSFREPSYESGRAQWWSIGMADQAPFCVAGLWCDWQEAEGGNAFSFTQITINATHYSLMRRFHKPDDEKRSLVIVPRSEYATWLACPNPEAARALLTLYPTQLMQAQPSASMSPLKAIQPQLF